MGATRIGAPIYTAGDTIRICFVETPNVLIELIEPLDDASDVAAFLRAHPGGAQHHLCYEVGDIDAAWAWFEGQGATFVCPIIQGVQGFPIFFIQAESLGGTLIELIETPTMKARYAAQTRGAAIGAI
jgi:methylmalonyl-CoA/ethylmalonyl-CoA epimerase